MEGKWDKIRSTFIYITPNEIRNATHLYVVCDVFGTPELYVFDFSTIPFNAVSIEVRHVLHMARCRDYEVIE